MTTGTAVAMLLLDPGSATPLYRQVYDCLRDAILSGQLAAGSRLPSTRALAAQLGVARITVATAFEELRQEGYLEARVGAGTYVARSLPDTLLEAAAPRPSTAPSAVAETAPSRRGEIIAATPVSATAQGRPARAFRPGFPALDLFPLQEWRRVESRAWAATPRTTLLGYGDAAGHLPLRAAIAAQLVASRGVQCTEDQVVVVNGAQQGLDLAARVLLDPGDAVWVEDPGRMGASAALRGAGAQTVGVPVDAAGLRVDVGVATAPAARLACVTPSHQFPLGVAMTLPRRLALLAWARAAGAWVLEDDYCSEHRYAGRPLPALQGLDTAGRVIYLGTFTRALFPALRLGYVVVPPPVVDAFVAGRALQDRHSPMGTQVALAAFLADGHYGRHLRRMRAAYAERQTALLRAAGRHLHGLLDVVPADAGMHVVGWLPDGVDDRAAERAAAAADVDVIALSRYAIEPLSRGALVMGYPVAPPWEIEAAVARLATALRGLA